MAFGMGMIARAAVGGIAGGYMAPGQGFSAGGAMGGALAGLAGPAFGRALMRGTRAPQRAFQAARRYGSAGSKLKANSAWGGMVNKAGSPTLARKSMNRRAGNILGALSVYAGAQMGASAFRSNRGY